MVSDLNDLHRHRGAGAVRVHWDEQHTIEPAAANGLRDRARLETIRLLVCCCGAHACGDVLRAVTQEMDDQEVQILLFRHLATVLLLRPITAFSELDYIECIQR